MSTKTNPFLQDTLPPFAGFPADALSFFRALRKNNTREWFAAHKDRYEASVKEPMESLLSALAEELTKKDPDIVIEPKRSMYRIYRDVRFSKDKSPYKTTVAAAFTYKGLNKNSDPAFYFQVSPDNVGIGGGLYMPSGDQVRKIRAAIASDSASLRSLLSARALRATFGELEGERLSRVPQGYEKDHPDADLLMLKQYLLWTEMEPEIALDSEFVQVLVKHFTVMLPVMRWLIAAVS